MSSDDDGSADGCGGPAITVEAAPEIAEVIQKVTADCDNIEVSPTSSAETAEKVVAGEGAPDVWIPDSLLWESRVAQRASTPPRRLITSLATTPIVIASRVKDPPTTWSDLISDRDLIMGDPTTSTAAVLPLVGTGAESDLEKSSQLIVPLAQAQSEGDGEFPTDAKRVELVESDEQALTAVSEQVVLSRAPKLPMTVPAKGTAFLDYPVLLTTSDDRRADVESTTEALTEVLRSPEFKERLTKAKFRSTDGADIKNGVQDITRLALPNANDLGSLLGRWGALGRPGWILTVVDVSGSMDFESGNSTRVELLASSVESSLRLFPDTAGMGIWVFSEKLEGDTDHRELLPTRQLDAEVGSGTQRDAILGEARKLPTMTTGGTGLYDTVLAAYRSAQEDWKPGAFNSVAIMTDGENEDPGSVSKEKLLSELRRLFDPAKPVTIQAFGITKDSDIESLREIAGATGGGAYEVLDPAQMAKYFTLALIGQPA
ncbi:VWA domain-containing protein [Nocardioides speluncae]|uniref:VWA domain-containing protein n=1 Tax=Nocardioides speluncae TaxID=2670337 RepID=UPI000D693294|nr:VWA domain-containing protein [Nocardioides speluncae]